MNRALTFFTQKHLYLGIVRYLLGLGMLPYALTKIFKTQLVLTGFAFTQTQTLETLSSKQLAWAFLGYSPWFQVLLGFLELIPAILLLFRRTTLLGAILMLPITLNVFLINYALVLWTGTKLISAVLLALNLIVLAFEWNKIKELILTIVAKGLRIKFTGIEIAVNVSVIAIAGYYFSKPLLDYRKQTNVLTGDWLNQRPIEWILQKEQSNDSILVHRDLKLYFGPLGMFNEVGDPKTTTRISYTIDPDKLQLDFKYNGDSTVNCTYQLIGETGLKIVRPVDTSKNTKLVQYFEKRIINAFRNN